MKNRKKGNVVPFERARRKPQPPQRYRLPINLRFWAVRAVILLAVVGGLVAMHFSSSARVVETVRLKPDHLRVVDADTIAVENSAIRLKGVAAPEAGHPDFAAGKLFLGKLLRRAEIVTCDLTAERTYGRRVGRCYFAMPDGKVIDVQREVVAAGHARACPNFGGWQYFLDETAASRILPFPHYCWGWSFH